MALNKKLIHFKKREFFDRELANNNILENSICFIQDSKQIYTYGVFYDCNIENINELNNKIDGVDKKVYVWNNPMIEDSGTITPEEVDAIAAANIVVSDSLVYSFKFSYDNTIILLSAAGFDIVNIVIDTSDFTYSVNTAKLIETDGDSIRFLLDDSTYKEITTPTKVSQLENDIPYVEEAPNDNSMYVRLNSNWTALDLTDTLSYGIKWQKDATSPICTRIGNPLLHKELPIQSQYRGCVYDFKTNTFKYWLDPNDWSKKEDGTASVLDGTDGDVCVHTPKFYGKSGEIDGYYWVRISTIQVDSSWIEIPEMYVGAYRSTVDRTNSLARSIINTSTQYRGGNNDSSYDTYLSTDKFRTMLGKPATNIARSSMRTYCRNSSSEMLSYEQYKWVFYWAYAIEYANFNCQAAYNSELTSDGYRQGGLGDGVTTWSDAQWNYYNYYNPVTPCGYGNSIGNFTGLKTISIPAQTGRNGSTAISAKTFNMPRWRGFDNPFGDIWTNLDGIIIQGKTDSSGNPSYKEVYTTTNVSNYGDTAEYMSKMKLAGIEIYQTGYILEFDLRDTAEIIPSKNGGNTTVGKCDYHYVQDSSTTYTNLRTLLVGGRASYGGLAGFGSFYSDSGVGAAWHYIGFRQVKTIE